MARIGIVAVLFAALAGCEKKEESAMPPPVVYVGKPVFKEVSDWNTYTGRLKAINFVDVRARVSGYLTEVKFQDGAMVKTGDVLYVIDPRPYQADVEVAQGALEKAQANLRNAYVDYQRAVDLRQKNVISAEDFDQRTASYLSAQGDQTQAQGNLQTAQLNLQFCTITSPIDGRLSNTKVTIGNLIDAGSSEPLTSIVSVDPIYAYAEVDENTALRYIRKDEKEDIGPQDVSKGKHPIYLQLPDENDFPHDGELDFINNQFDAGTGTVTIRGIFANPKGLFVPGMFVRVRFPFGKPYQGLLIPPSAIGNNQSQRYVLTVDKDNVARYNPVVLGPMDGSGLQIIKSGIKPDDTIVVEGIVKVRPNEKVNPKPAPTPTPSPSPKASPAAGDSEPKK